MASPLPSIDVPRPRTTQPAIAAPSTGPILSADERRARALHDGARPLIALATQLRQAVVDRPAAMKKALGDAVERFEADLAAAGWDPRGVFAASFLLCAWVDEVVADTPWGGGGAGLLERFHGESGGSGRVLRLLSRLAEQPQENRALLELFHACLSLGLNGHLRGMPDAAAQLDRLRARVFLALPREQPALAPPWQAAVRPASAGWRRRVVPGALLLLALATLGVYTTSHLLLASQVDEVFASMQRLGPAPAVVATAAPGASGAAVSVAAAPPADEVARLAPLLAAEQSTGRLLVRDEAHRSIVSVPATSLFEPDSTQLASGAAPLLARVAIALAAHPGKVLVIGYTDGTDRRSARLPSAWHQSYEWARETANSLGRTLAAERLTVEGAADSEQPVLAAAPANTTANTATNTPPLPRRRVDIVLFP